MLAIRHDYLETSPGCKMSPENVVYLAHSTPNYIISSSRQLSAMRYEVRSTDNASLRSPCSFHSAALPLWNRKCAEKHEILCHFFNHEEKVILMLSLYTLKNMTSSAVPFPEAHFFLVGINVEVIPRLEFYHSANTECLLHARHHTKLQKIF